MAEPEDWRALRIARAWGVSPRRFLGWEPAQTVTYVRDQAGRIVTAHITTEPEWDESDIRLAFALEDYEARLCRGCGDDLEETTKTENHEAYEPLPIVVCFRCKERKLLEEQQESKRKIYGDALQLNVRKKLAAVKKLVGLGSAQVPAPPPNNLSEPERKTTP